MLISFNYLQFLIKALSTYAGTWTMGSAVWSTQLCFLPFTHTWQETLLRDHELDSTTHYCQCRGSPVRAFHTPARSKLLWQGAPSGEAASSHGGDPCTSGAGESWKRWSSMLEGPWNPWAWESQHPQSPGLRSAWNPWSPKPWGFRTGHGQEFWEPSLDSYFTILQKSDKARLSNISNKLSS